MDAILFLVMLMLAEHDLSSLSCMCMYVDHPTVYTPNIPSGAIGPSQLTNQSKCSISRHNKNHMATE